MRNKNTTIPQCVQTSVNIRFILFRVYGKDLKCWYGTHRNENGNFEKNIFSSYKPNSYKYSLEEAKILSENLECDYEQLTT